MSIYGIIGAIDEGRTWANGGHIIRMWPVCYRLDESDALAAKAICEQQRDAFLVELEPIWDAIQTSPTVHRGKRIPRAAAIERENAARAQQAKLKDQEAMITARWANDMLDPLFPTATNGGPPLNVVYKIIRFLDDPRELGAAELMKMRAELHGASDEDDDELDEDF